MKTLSYVLVASIILSVCAAAGNGLYYYYKGEKMPIAVDSSKLFILSSESFEETEEILESKYPGVSLAPQGRMNIEGFEVLEINGNADYKQLATLLKQDSIISCVNPVILSADSTPVYVGKTFVCRFHPSTSWITIDSLIKHYDLNTVRESEYMAGEYLLQIPDRADFSVFEISNSFYTLDLVDYCHPDFYAPVIYDSYQPQDYYYSYQKTIQMIVGFQGYENAAWEITKGDSNISVAILDDGFEFHEDLDTNRFLPGYDFVDDDNDPSYSYTDSTEFHGMAIAGLIFGLHNNITPHDDPGSKDATEVSDFMSVAGLCPRCSFIPVRMFSEMAPSSQVALSINFAWQNGAAVINNCWTWNGDPVDNIDAAIDSAYQFGRNGLGWVVVLSAGNWSGEMKWPKTKETVFSVGAIDTNGIQYGYSCSSDSLDLVAPSGGCGIPRPGDTLEGFGVWTTDRMDDFGYIPLEYDRCRPINNVNYVCAFQGTSAAAPLVSGTAALLLSRRPDLSVAQVFDILKSSAEINISLNPPITPPNYWYGYGMVHTLRALLAISRGDADNTGSINLGDAGYIVNYIFYSGPDPVPHLAPVMPIAKTE